MRGIRVRLILCISILFIAIGILIYLPLSVILPRKISAQILKRDIQIARHMADELKKKVLFNDNVALSLSLYDNLERLPDARYLFIQRPDGSILSHTFLNGFPKGLVSFNSEARHADNIKAFLSSGIKIYDIAIPLLKGEMGVLHLGVSLESGKNDVAQMAKINYYIGIVILIGLGIGVITFLAVGLLFSRQLIKLKNFAAKIGKGDLEDKIDINSQDEIGDLAAALNEMALSLKEKIREIKRLNTLEERNRIALDFHDGCLQDIANIIKRVELAEKLFKIEPGRALEELYVLKADAKDVLSRARKTIFDLKLPHYTEPGLLNNLRNYIKNYEGQNDIVVRLDVLGSLDGLTQGTAKNVFYIILEALNNIKKHSMAKNVELRLERNSNNELVVNIKDDGQGFDIETKKPAFKLGLSGMRQRTDTMKGSLSVNSVPEQGTEICVRIPLGMSEDNQICPKA